MFATEEYKMWRRQRLEQLRASRGEQQAPPGSPGGGVGLPGRSFQQVGYTQSLPVHPHLVPGGAFTAGPASPPRGPRQAFGDVRQERTHYMDGGGGGGGGGGDDDLQNIVPEVDSARGGGGGDGRPYTAPVGAAATAAAAAAVGGGGGGGDGFSPAERQEILDKFTGALEVLQELKQRVSGAAADDDDDDGSPTAGADPNRQATLNAAALRGQHHLVRRCLIAAPGNVNGTDRDGRTPLINACAHDYVQEEDEDPIRPNQPNYIKTVKLLADPDKDKDDTSFLNLRDKRGRTALWEAIDSNESKIVQHLCSDELHELGFINPNYPAPNPADEEAERALNPYWTPWQGALAKKGDASIAMLEALCKAQARGEAHARETALEDLRARVKAVRGPDAEPTALERKENREGAAASAWTRMTDSDGWLATSEERKTDGEMKEVWGERGSAVHVAVETDDFDKVEVLLAEYPCNFDGDEFVTLFDPRAVNDKKETALMLACKRGNQEQVERLLQYAQHHEGQDGVQVDINAQNNHGMTALMMAIINGHDEVVEILMENKNLQRHPSTLHHEESHAAKQGDAKVLQKHNLDLLSSVAPAVGDDDHDDVRSHADGDHERRAAIHYCALAEFEMENVALLLLKLKCDVNIVDSEGNAPIHYAATNGHIKILRALLEYNANIGAKNRKGEIALHKAAEHGWINIVVELLKQGSEVMPEDFDGKSPLHSAFGRVAMLHLANEGDYNVFTKGSRFHKAFERAKVFNVFVNLLEEVQERHGTHQGRKPHDREMHDNFKNAEHKFLDMTEMSLESQHMLIKVLLDKGADLDHEDSNGEPAFIKKARKLWYERSKDEMQRLVDNPNEKGYDSELFTDPRTQAAVAWAFVDTGGRKNAIKGCISWLVFLALFVFIAVYNAGRNNFNTYSFEYSLRTLYIDEEWDDRQHFGFGDVANTEEWYGFIKPVEILQNPTPFLFFQMIECAAFAHSYGPDPHYLPSGSAMP